MKYLDFLHSELKLAPSTIWYSFSKLDTNYQNMEDRNYKVYIHVQQNCIVNSKKMMFQIDQVLNNTPNEGKPLLYKAAVCVFYMVFFVVPFWLL